MSGYNIVSPTEQVECADFASQLMLLLHTTHNITHNTMDVGHSTVD